ncbi:MAG TPA: hypothetical protein VMZ27_16175 [Candidatus Saccharimonadales bacterium]|nr:hypothetical protein [Candidatus Saccharimonadales bacterium]
MKRTKKVQWPALAILLLSILSGKVLAISTNELGAAHFLKIVTQAGYLPGVPVLVRMELHKGLMGRERELWDAEATLSADGGTVLSTNRVQMRNGLGSALVTFTGGNDFTLTAKLGALQATHALTSLATTVAAGAGGTLPAGETVWSGLVRVTNDVTVPVGSTLTILSNTLVIVDGVASGTVANDLVINGTLNSLGTEDKPVTITCSTAGLRWGQIRHNSSQPSLYRFTSITRAGRAGGEGHTGTAPVIRPTNSRLRFEGCNLTDYAEGDRSAAGFGGPGKVMVASGSDLVFDNCLFARARMGPEVSTSAVLCTNTWITDMPGPDDADGFYVHDQSAGQQVLFTGCVIADGDDDGIDTLGSFITVENCIIRDWDNLQEDAKGISVLNGIVNVYRSLIVNSTVGIAAKSGGSTPSTTPVLVNILNCTMTGNGTNVLANRKSSAVGPVVHMNITNSILWGGNPVQSDFEPTSSNSTNFTIVYCNLSETQGGTGNLQLDPLFANAAGHDFHLNPFSPSIDSANPAAAKDPDGSPADQGCFTFIPPSPTLSGAQVLGNGTAQFVLTGYTNRNYVIDAAEVLTNWVYLKTTFQSDASVVVSDPGAAGLPHRFYRARLAP